MLSCFAIACASTPSLHTPVPSEPKPLASSDQICQRSNKPKDAGSCGSVKEGRCPGKGDLPERKAGVYVQPFFNVENPCDRGRLRVLSCDRGPLSSHLGIQAETPPVPRKPSSCSPTDQEATLLPKRRERHWLEDNNTYHLI